MNKLKKYCTIFLLVLLVPLGLVFTACGATPSNEVKGVFFESSIYDEETGYAVFEVDVGITTKLSFKVTPSSWSGYNPVYQVLRSGNSNENLRNFNLENGNIYVRNSDFEAITVQIQIGDYKDICIIRLKEYPIDIFFIDEDGRKFTEYDEIISANSSYNIHVFGEFKTSSGENIIREVKDDEFKFKVISSDDTVIEIKNSDRLTVNTLKNKVESSTVTVALLDATGANKFGTKELKINFNVIPLINHGYLDLAGYNHFILSSPEDPITINSTNSDIGSRTINGEDYFVIGFDLCLVSGANEIINPSSGSYLNSRNYGVEVSTSENRYVLFDRENSEILIKKMGSLEFGLTFWSNLNTEAGTPYSLSLTINFVA